MSGDNSTRTVRVRVDAVGERMVGECDLPSPPSYRFSDVLNEPGDYIKLRLIVSASGKKSGEVAVRKDTVRYVEVLEEPSTVYLETGGTFREVTISFRDKVEALHGELFLPTNSDVIGVLNDPRAFVGMRNVSFVKSNVRHAFLILGKRQISIVG